MNFTWLILGLIGGLWCIGIFWGYLTGMGKSFRSPSTNSIQSSQLKLKQRQAIEDIEERRQKLMEDLKQKISDNRRNR